MIISRGRRFIFVHIPKTGGTALSLALEARAMKDDILIGDTPKARARKGRLHGVRTAGRLWKHSTLSDVLGLVTEDEIARFYTFALVRNPWDRAVSYYHWLRGQAFAHPAVGLAKAHDFSGFLHHPHTQTSLRLWPYGAYLRDGHGVERASHFIRLEWLAEDLAPLEAHLGFRLVLEKINASDRDPDWRPYFAPRDVDLIAGLCAEDIDRFGYTFDGFR
ncbi:sulfotransferase family 2 domain-containing protein [Pseudotabrizicola sp. L79]|uniref:sulfotransferase family 2 domain-containing protein n=1 Tax=Pseudotabrizicola sp. L79 TaxID=3118402 RepID=UPI002F93F7F3